MATSQVHHAEPRRKQRVAATPVDYPVREYIAGMARELAQMARWGGDDVLAGLLEAVMARAMAPRP